MAKDKPSSEKISNLQVLAKEICKHSKPPVTSGLSSRIKKIKDAAAKGGANAVTPNIKGLFNRIHSKIFALERAINAAPRGVEVAPIFSEVDEYFGQIYKWSLNIEAALTLI